MAKYKTSDIIKQTDKLYNMQPAAAIMCLFIIIILSAGFLSGCGGSGSDGDGNEPLNGIDTTESLNQDSVKLDGVDWG